MEARESGAAIITFPDMALNAKGGRKIPKEYGSDYEHYIEYEDDEWYYYLDFLDEEFNNQTLEELVEDLKTFIEYDDDLVRDAGEGVIKIVPKREHW